MEMPELNEDLLEGESNPDVLNQADDSASLDDSTTLQTEDQIAMDIDSTQTKSEEIESEEKMKEQDESEDTLDDADLQKQHDDSQENLPRDESLSENLEDKQEEMDKPAKKKLKLEEESKVYQSESEMEQEQQLKQILKAESESKNQSQPHPEVDTESQPEEAESQELEDIRKEDEEKLDTISGIKEGEKASAGPDTDMLATLASAALEQDPKDKVTPKSPLVKTESEAPKKKPEMWCNVGVFDTNTTIVSDYLATPEANENVDLVTATLGGRRIQLEPGTAYKFRVCAVNGCGTGPWSDVAAFKTTLPGFPGAPSAIKISKSPEGAHLTWEPPGGNSSEILEYAVYLAVRSASQGCQPVTTNQAQLAFVRVFCGPTNKCMVGTNSLQAAHIDTTTKPAIIFRIAARNSKGYGPATQVRWLQESQNGTSQGVKRSGKS